MASPLTPPAAWNSNALTRWPGTTIPIDDGGGRWFFDDDEAARAVDFPPTFLRLLKGKGVAGEPMQYLDWARELVIRPLFGWKRTSDGLRRFRKVFVFVPKKQTKSLLCSAVGLYLTFCDREPSAEVIACAADRQQAMEVFKEARDMAEGSPDLAARSEILRRAIVVPETRSVFRVVSSEVRGSHGPSIHGLIFDEFHAQPDRDLYDALSKGIAARPQPVVLIITTAGDDTDSVCYEEYEYAKRVLHGVVDDPEYLPVVFEAKPEDDWRDPKVWERVNPAFGVTVQREFYESECRAAVAEPRKQAAFKRYFLNLWTAAKETWIPAEWWKECPPLPDAKVLAGLPVAGGLDLSSTTDLTAFVLVFRLPESKCPGQGETKVEVAEETAPGKVARKVLSINYDLAVLPCLFMPEERLHERSREDGVDYSVWVRQGHLHLTPGAVVDYDFVFRTAMEAAENYKAKEIGFDPWNATQFALQLEKAGLQPVEVRQGPKTLSAACKVFYALVKAGRVHHGANPAMAWCVGNAAVKADENENLRLLKSNPKKRIDGLAAAVTALSRLMVQPDRASRKAHIAAF